MKILLDKHAGFCSGVKRAIRKTLSLAAEKPGVTVMGELIHNPVVTEELETKGVQTVDDTETLDDGSFAIIRTHGVPPDREEVLVRRGIPYEDLTCPRVKAVHRTIEAYKDKGYRIAVVGNPKHPEVAGHLGYAGEAGILMASVEDAEACQPLEKLVVLAQTTISPSLFERVTSVLRKKVKEFVVGNTLCSTFLRRLAWIEEHSQKAQASLIVGGKNSSNTAKLHQIASEHGRAFWIERAEEMPAELFALSPVALTAGASTPRESLMKVIARLEEGGAEIIES
jgi:4-hydroxy-3-methylbut-2-enyl diphosphate reductase